MNKIISQRSRQCEENECNVIESDLLYMAREELSEEVTYKLLLK